MSAEPRKKRTKIADKMYVEDSLLELRDVVGKGRGVFTTRLIEKGELIMKYDGEHISEAEAIRREDLYGAGNHCYMFFYTVRNRNDKKIVMCVDGTKANGFSRMINHSKKSFNLKPEYVNGEIWFRAAANIQPGTELLFDYNETRKDVLDINVWLKE